MNPIWLGNEAIAAGAYAAGVSVVSSYPGTPSTEITEAVARYDRIKSEWAPNEKVSLEVAIGASVAGVRAMSCMKHVGLNVAADPLFTASYTGVNGGLVVVVADDPGMHSSQNEQDSRHYARAAKIPLFEPADSQECYDMVQAAFDLSEKYDTPVIVRLTTRVSHTRSPVVCHKPGALVHYPYKKDIQKYVMMPAMARGRHQAVESRMVQLAADSEKVGRHTITERSTKMGVITSGIVSRYAAEAFPDASVFKLGLVWPLPIEEIRRFANKVERLVVAEELDPVIETTLRAAGILCEGKERLTPLGEYTASLLRQAFKKGQDPESAISQEALPPAPPRPPVMCAGCPHRGLFMALKRLKVTVTGDIGCYTLGALDPVSAMDTCVCMGASIGMAHGMLKAKETENTGDVVAVIGDSTFLHSGMTGLLNSVYNQSDSTLLILDNSITGMTGHQHNPSTGYDLHQQPAPAVDLEMLCRTLGARSVRVVDPADPECAARVVSEETGRKGVSVVIARRPCALIPQGRGQKEQAVFLDRERCTKCGACIRVYCPALTQGDDGYPVIDAVSCNGCGLCVRVCPFDALRLGGEAE